MDSDSLAYSTSAVDVGAALAAAAAATSDERESAPKHDADLFMDREGSSDGGNEGDDDGDPFQRSTDALQAAVQALTLEDSTTSTGALKAAAAQVAQDSSSPTKRNGSNASMEKTLRAAARAAENELAMDATLAKNKPTGKLEAGGSLLAAAADAVASEGATALKAAARAVATGDAGATLRAAAANVTIQEAATNDDGGGGAVNAGIRRAAGVLGASVTRPRAAKTPPRQRPKKKQPNIPKMRKSSEAVAAARAAPLRLSASQQCMLQMSHRAPGGTPRGRGGFSRKRMDKMSRSAEAEAIRKAKIERRLVDKGAMTREEFLRRRAKNQFASLDDAKNCTFKPKVKKNPFGEVKAVDDEAARGSLYDRLEDGEKARLERLKERQGKLAYDMTLVKKQCSGCPMPAIQSYDEVVKKIKRCQECGTTYKLPKCNTSALLKRLDLRPDHQRQGSVELKFKEMCSASLRRMKKAVDEECRRRVEKFRSDLEDERERDAARGGKGTGKVKLSATMEERSDKMTKYRKKVSEFKAGVDGKFSARMFEAVQGGGKVMCEFLVRSEWATTDVDDDGDDVEKTLLLRCNAFLGPEWEEIEHYDELLEENRSAQELRKILADDNLHRQRRDGAAHATQCIRADQIENWLVAELSPYNDEGRFDSYDDSLVTKSELSARLAPLLFHLERGKEHDVLLRIAREEDDEITTVQKLRMMMRCRKVDPESQEDEDAFRYKSDRCLKDKCSEWAVNGGKHCAAHRESKRDEEECTCLGQRAWLLLRTDDDDGNGGDGRLNVWEEAFIKRLANVIMHGWRHAWHPAGRRRRRREPAKCRQCGEVHDASELKSVLHRRGHYCVDCVKTLVKSPESKGDEAKGERAWEWDRSQPAGTRQLPTRQLAKCRHCGSLQSFEREALAKQKECKAQCDGESGDYEEPETDDADRRSDGPGTCHTCGRQHLVKKTVLAEGRSVTIYERNCPVRCKRAQSDPHSCGRCTACCTAGHIKCGDCGALHSFEEVKWQLARCRSCEGTQAYTNVPPKRCCNCGRVDTYIPERGNDAEDKNADGGADGGGSKGGDRLGEQMQTMARRRKKHRDLRDPDRVAARKLEREQRTLKRWGDAEWDDFPAWRGGTRAYEWDLKDDDVDGKGDDDDDEARGAATVGRWKTDFFRREGPFALNEDDEGMPSSRSFGALRYYYKFRPAKDEEGWTRVPEWEGMGAGWYKQEANEDKDDDDDFDDDDEDSTNIGRARRVQRKRWKNRAMEKQKRINGDKAHWKMAEAQAKEAQARQDVWEVKKRLEKKRELLQFKRSERIRVRGELGSDYDGSDFDSEDDGDDGDAW